MPRLFETKDNNFITPNKQQHIQRIIDTSSGRFASTGRYRKHRIFESKKKQVIDNFLLSNYTESRRYQHFKTSSNFKDQVQKSHIVIKQAINDDFCGCENTLTLCKRIKLSYIQNPNFLNELKSQYEQVQVKNETMHSNKINKKYQQYLINHLVGQYPQIYFTHLKKLLLNLQSKQITDSSFLCLAWIQFHCKFQYITYFFFLDLKKKFNNEAKFIQLCDLDLQRFTSIKQEINRFQKFNMQIQSFFSQFYESVGTIIIPLSQYAKFMQLLKKLGQIGLARLLCLLIVNKKEEFYQILKYWTYSQFKLLRTYSKGLNWDVFFQQIQVMK